MNFSADSIGNVANTPFLVHQTETKRSVENGSAPRLPRVLILQAFSYLTLTELGDCRQLSKQYHSLVTDEEFLHRIYAIRAFGQNRWAKHFGKVGEVPFLKDIHKIMQADCPIWNGKKVIQTHVLMLLPDNVQDKELTINRLGELARNPRKGFPTSYECIWEQIVKTFGDQPVGKTYWMLMTKEVVPESRGKSYDDQSKLVASITTKAGVEYAVPRIIEVAACIFAKYVSAGIFLYNDDEMSFTYCQEKIDTHQSVVGGFAPAGLIVSAAKSKSLLNGVALVRKL